VQAWQIQEARRSAQKSLLPAASASDGSILRAVNALDPAPFPSSELDVLPCESFLIATIRTAWERLFGGSADTSEPML